MKKIIITTSIAILPFMLFNSCNKKTERKKEIENIDSTSQEETSITFEAKFSKNDIIRLYYLQQGDKDYTIKNSITKNVYGDSEFQTYVFKIPKSIKLSNIQIQLGEIRQNQAIIKNISITKGDKIIDGSDGAYLNYFYSTDNLIYDSENYTFSSKKINQEYSNLFLIGNNDLINSLKNL